MTRAIDVVLRLGNFSKAGKTVELPDRHHTIEPASQHLMNIALVTRIPDQPVDRAVEHIVERNCQLNNAEVAAEMTTHP